MNPVMTHSPKHKYGRHPLAGQTITAKQLLVPKDKETPVVEAIKMAVGEKLPTGKRVYSTLAARIKAGLDEHTGMGKWQVIVGSSFSLSSSNISSNSFAHFEIGPYVNVIVYRTEKKSKPPKAH